MSFIRTPGRRWVAASTMAAGGAAALLVLSACASSTPAGSASVSSATGAGAAGSAAVISTASGANGTHLVGPSGNTVYLWVADKSSTSTCNGSCAAAWPPVTTKGTPAAAGSAVSKDLGTTKRSDGSEQVTYDGHPLYYYSGDSATGQANGQGSNGFGAKWWLVAPSGSAITSSAAGGSGAGSSGGSYGGY